MAGCPSWSRPHNREADIADMFRFGGAASFGIFAIGAIVNSAIIGYLGLVSVPVCFVLFIRYEIRARRKWKTLSVDEKRAAVRAWNDVAPFSDAWWLSEG